MIRQILASHASGGESDFRWRGKEISRLESFSDAVFAFAVTLLVVSLEVPKTYPELMQAIRGFLPFAVCFGLLANVWYQHYRFFRRYALENPWIVFLNCMLLFFVLFYVYPLKFLSVSLFNSNGLMDATEARSLFVIFGVGLAAVFLVFMLLHVHALRHGPILQLNALETMNTRHSIIHNSVMAAFGLLSAGLALLLPLGWEGIAGYIYLAIGLYFIVSESIFGRHKRRLVKRHSPSSHRP